MIKEGRDLCKNENDTTAPARYSEKAKNMIIDAQLDLDAIVDCVPDNYRYGHRFASTAVLCGVSNVIARIVRKNRRATLANALNAIVPKNHHYTIIRLDPRLNDALNIILHWAHCGELRIHKATFRDVAELATFLEIDKIVSQLDTIATQAGVSFVTTGGHDENGESNDVVRESDIRAACCSFDKVVILETVQREIFIGDKRFSANAFFPDGPPPKPKQKPQPTANVTSQVPPNQSVNMDLENEQDLVAEFEQNFQSEPKPTQENRRKDRSPDRRKNRSPDRRSHRTSDRSKDSRHRSDRRDRSPKRRRSPDRSRSSHRGYDDSRKQTGTADLAHTSLQSFYNEQPAVPAAPTNDWGTVANASGRVAATPHWATANASAGYADTPQYSTGYSSPYAAAAYNAPAQTTSYQPPYTQPYQHPAPAQAQPSTSQTSELYQKMMSQAQDLMSEASRLAENATSSSSTRTWRS